MKKFKNTQRLYTHSGYVFTVFAIMGLLLSWFNTALFARLAQISSICALAVLVFTLFMVPLALIFDCQAHKEKQIVWLILLILVLFILVALAIFLTG